MGLVIQAPVDALLATAGAPAAGAKVSGEAPAGDIFANLLASLGSNARDSAGELMPLTGGIELLPSAEETGESDEKDRDPLAALLALGVPLNMPKAAVQDVPPAGELSGAAATQVGAPAERGPEASRIELMPGEMVAEPQEAAAAPFVQGDVPTEAIPRHTTESGPRTSSIELMPSAEEMAIAGETGEPPMETRTAEAPPLGPTEAVEAEVSSVVRPVGNAQTQGHEEGAAGDSGGNGTPAGPAELGRPRPRASDNGVAHAAANSAVGELRQRSDVQAAEAPAAAAEPAPAQDVPPQVEQVASTVIERVEAGGGEARIHLDPVDLGEVTIHVHTQGDSVRVEVRAERQEAMQLLRDHTQDLSNLLGERGLNLSDVNVGLGRGNGEQGWGEQTRRQPAGNASDFAAIFGGDDTNIEIHQRLRAAYNPDGALVYRV